MKKSSIIVLIALIVIMLTATLSGCSKSASIVEKQTEYLNDKGYNIVETKGISDNYILEKDILTEQPNNLIWGVQTSEPQNYFGKTIDTYSYIVNNHKLDDSGDKGETQLWLLICEEKIIGGYSFPNNSEPLYGGIYSLEGMTLEEVVGMNFQTWSENWMDKYKAD